MLFLLGMHYKRREFLELAQYIITKQLLPTQTSQAKK